MRVDPKNSTVALSWAPPTYSNVEVTGYEVNFGGGAGKMRTIDGASNTTLTLSVPTDVDAFVQTPFHVRALSGAHTGEWSSRTVYIGRYRLQVVAVETAQTFLSTLGLSTHTLWHYKTDRLHHLTLTTFEATT